MILLCCIYPPPIFHGVCIKLIYCIKSYLLLLLHRVSLHIWYQYNIIVSGSYFLFSIYCHSPDYRGESDIYLPFKRSVRKLLGAALKSHSQYTLQWLAWCVCSSKLEIFLKGCWIREREFGHQAEQLQAKLNSTISLSLNSVEQGFHSLSLSLLF